MKRNRLLVSQHDTVLNMFELGLSKIRIADSLNVPIGAVAKVINTKYPNFNGRVLLPVKELVSKYKKGSSISDLSLEYNVSHNTVKRRLVEAGVEFRPAGDALRVHYFNESYFEVIDSPTKAYWLGFMFADGMVMSTRTDVVLGLSTKDREHLVQFARDIEYSGPGLVKDYKSSGMGTTVKYSRVSLRSEKMWMDLIDKGCIPNKSLDLSPPLNLPDEYLVDFVRGVVDGDGYLSKAGYPAFEICGAHGLLEWIAENFSMSEPRPMKSIWRIRANGQAAIDLTSTLYYEGARSLARKHEAAQVMSNWVSKKVNLSPEEKSEIQKLSGEGKTAQEIAGILKREVSTIYKELKR